MQRQRGELVPIGDALADLPGPVKAIREATPLHALHAIGSRQQTPLWQSSPIAAAPGGRDLGACAVRLSLHRNGHRQLRCGWAAGTKGHSFAFRRCATSVRMTTRMEGLGAASRHRTRAA